MVATSEPFTYTFAMPHSSHGKPIQLMAVPVNVSVAVDRAAFEPPMVPSLDATAVSSSENEFHDPVDVAALSSTLVTVVEDGGGGGGSVPGVTRPERLNHLVRPTSLIDSKFWISRATNGADW